MFRWRAQCQSDPTSWDRQGFSSKAMLARFAEVHLLIFFSTAQTQPVSMGGLGTAGRFLAIAGMQDFANAV